MLSKSKANPKLINANNLCRVTDTSGNTRSAGQAYNEAQQAKEDVKSQAYEQKNQAQSQSGPAKEQAKGHASDIASARDPNASYSTQKDQMLGRAQDKVPDDAQNYDKEDAKGQARGKVQDLKNRIPDEHRERAANAINETKDFLNEQFPEERRDQFIYRLKKVSIAPNKNELF